MGRGLGLAPASIYPGGPKLKADKAAHYKHVNLKVWQLTHSLACVAGVEFWVKCCTKLSSKLLKSVEWKWHQTFVFGWFVFIYPSYEVPAGAAPTLS